MSKKNLLIIIPVIALVFGMTVVGCDPDNGNGNGNGDEGKKITVTGIIGKSGEAMIVLVSNMDNEIIDAMGIGKIANNSVTFKLIKDEYMNPFNGSGSFYLQLYFDVDDSGYVYTDGESLENLGITTFIEEDVVFMDSVEASENLPKLNISSSSSTVSFGRFVRGDGFYEQASNE